ncbi:MAG: phage tail tube protein [Patescibacteria group bacterium]
MAKFIGRKISVGFGKETVRGTGVAPTAWYPKTNFSVEEKIDTIVDESSIGVIVDSQDQQIVKRFSEGSVEGHFAVNAIALPLLSLFGAVTTTSPSAGAYKHAFTLGNTNQSPSITIGMDDGVQDYQFPNAVVDKMKIKVEAGKFVEVTTDFVGKKGETATLTPSFSTDYVLAAKHASVKVAANLAGLTGATALAVKSFELTISKKVEAQESLGTTDPTDFINTVVSIEGNLEALYEDEATYKAVALAGSQKSIRLDVIDSGTTIGASTNPQLRIDLAKAKFKEWSRKTGNNEVVTQSLGFKGLYSLSDAQAIVAELYNTVTSL